MNSRCCGKFLGILVLSLFVVGCGDAAGALQSPGSSGVPSADTGNLSGNAGKTGVQAGPELEIGVSEQWARLIEPSDAYSIYTPIAGQGIVAYSAVNQDSDLVVYVFDQKTGDKLWDGWSEEVRYGGGIAIGDEMLYLGNGGQLFAFGLRDGLLKWDINVGLDACHDCTNPFWPVFHNGTVFATFGDVVVAIDAAKGSEIWTTKLLGDLEDNSTIAIDDDVVAVGRQDSLDALDAKTGKQLWSQNLGNLNSSSPMVSGGTVYICYRNAARFIAYDAKTGDQRWSNTAEECGRSVVTADLVLIEMGGTIHKFDVKGGEEKGQIEEYEQAGSSCALAISADTIYGCATNNLIGYNIENGKESFRVSVGNDFCYYDGCFSIWSRPFVLDGMAFVMSKSPPSDSRTSYALFGIGVP